MSTGHRHEYTHSLHSLAVIHSTNAAQLAHSAHSFVFISALPACWSSCSINMALFVCQSVSQSVSFPISQSPSHSVNLLSLFDTINMHRHQLNCISFIAKQQQLLPKIRKGIERGAWPTGVKFHFTLLPYTSMRNKTEQNKQRNKLKIKANRTQQKCSVE